MQNLTCRIILLSEFGISITCLFHTTYRSKIQLKFKHLTCKCRVLFTANFGPCLIYSGASLAVRPAGEASILMKVCPTGRKNRYACALKMVTVKIQNGGQRIAFLHVTGEQFTTAHLSSRCVFWLNFELNSFTVRQASSDDNRIPFT